MHTLITGWPYVDHEDHDGLNNQRYNMRRATQVQNSAHQRPRLGTASRFKGVGRQKQRWIASIRVNGRLRYLGSFLDEETAARVYDAAAVAAWGAYAYVNFPEPE